MTWIDVLLWGAILANVAVTALNLRNYYAAKERLKQADAILDDLERLRERIVANGMQHLDR